jgi:hypothetical protein
MSPSPADRPLKEQLVEAMIEATFPLQQGPDPEVTLEALIEATALLRQRFEHELAELRQEQAE